jgi:hypothetical protein
MIPAEYFYKSPLGESCELCGLSKRDFADLIEFDSKQQLGLVL